MTDREFVTEIRRAIIIMVRAMIKRYGMAWADFLPRESTGNPEVLTQQKPVLG